MQTRNLKLFILAVTLAAFSTALLTGPAWGDSFYVPEQKKAVTVKAAEVPREFKNAKFSYEFDSEALCSRSIIVPVPGAIDPTHIGGLSNDEHMCQVMELAHEIGKPVTVYAVEKPTPGGKTFWVVKVIFEGQPPPGTLR